MSDTDANDTPLKDIPHDITRAVNGSVGLFLVQYCDEVADSKTVYRPDVYEELWLEASKELCDQFPNIEMFVPIETIRAAWVAELSKRYDLVRLLELPNGPELVLNNLQKTLEVSDV